MSGILKETKRYRYRVDKAIVAIEERNEGASFSYRKFAQEFDISRATLQRRHQGVTDSNAVKSEQQQKFTPQQENERRAKSDSAPPRAASWKQDSGLGQRRDVSQHDQLTDNTAHAWATYIGPF
jgi:AraC-like DNA-binding protein